MINLIIHSARQLVAVIGTEPKSGERQGEMDVIENGAVAASGQEIVKVGPTAEVLAMADPSTRLIDASGKIVLPGFVDAHTHAVFAGDRAAEFEQRLRGASYQEIMALGGGILSTVRATRAATLERIVDESRPRLLDMFAHGTTTAECKTGYGLDTENELKLLDAIHALDRSLPLELVPTLLAAHAVPEEYKRKPDEFIGLVIRELLPRVLEQERQGSKDRRPAPIFCDVFCDEGAFTVAQSRRLLTRAADLGFGIKIHADEFANLGGATLAAELGAVSADHLMVTRREEMKALARSRTIAVLLPGTTFGLGKHDFADGRTFVQENVPVALGTDLNPGTSWCGSMPMMIALATRYEQLSPAEAIVAATLNAAYASGVGDRVGSLQAGKQADILIADVPDYRHLAYRYGGNPITTVVKRGRVVIPSQVVTAPSRVAPS